MRRSHEPVYSLRYHPVWFPKYGRPVSAGIVADRLYEGLATKAREIDAEIHALEVLPDQLFVQCDGELTLAHHFNGFTSRLLRQEFASMRSRLPTRWLRCYLVGSVWLYGPNVRHYIESQRRR